MAHARSWLIMMQEADTECDKVWFLSSLVACEPRSSHLALCRHCFLCDWVICEAHSGFGLPAGARSWLIMMQ